MWLVAAHGQNDPARIHHRSRRNASALEQLPSHNDCPFSGVAGNIVAGVDVSMGGECRDPLFLMCRHTRTQWAYYGFPHDAFTVKVDKKSALNLPVLLEVVAVRDHGARVEREGLLGGGDT
jgi:hypothetical protein